MTNPKLSTLVDAFTGTTINLSVWNSSTGGGIVTLDQVNDRAQIAFGTSASTYNSLGAGGPYDATGSGLYARIGAGPNGAGGVQSIMKLAVDPNNSIQAVVNSGGSFLLQVQTAGSYATTTLPAYNPSTHAWWQLAESGGNFTFSTSPDGMAWTALATVAHSWSATALMVYFQAGVTDTEPAGQQMWVAHVNTPLGGTLNPNVPVTEHAWGPSRTANGASAPIDQYVNISDRTRNRIALQRGRQYELDQVRSGTVTGEWRNTDGAFDPNNTSGPWYGHVNLFAPYRVRAQWPPRVNLLTQVQATGGDLGGISAGTIPQGVTGIGVTSATDSTGGSIVASTSAWQGGSVFQFTVPASTASGSRICATAQPAVEPGLAYSIQLQARSITASTSLMVQAFIAWYTAAGALISTTTGSSSTLTGGTAPAWTQLTASGTAPANTGYWVLGVQTAATSPGTGVSVQVDGWQTEQAATPSLWTCPGFWYPVFAGFVERYPQVWANSGTYGTVRPQAYDAMALLSQRLLPDPLTGEIKARSPRFVYTLGDPQNSSFVTDTAGNTPLAQIAVSKDGAGSLTLGNQITAANLTTGIYTGSTDTVATLNNSNPGTGTVSAATYIDLTFAGVKGPAGGTWSRAIAFRYTGPTPTSGNQAVIWAGFASNYQVTPVPGGAQVTAYIDQNGHVNVSAVDNSNAGGTLTNTSINVVDSNWHLVIWGATAGSQFISVDGSYTTGSSAYGSTSTLVTDSIGAWVDPSIGNDTRYNYKGDLSFAIEWPSFLASADCTTIYSAWRGAFSGESSDTRYKRILGWAGYTGATSAQAGLTTSMGLATTVTGQDGLTALQAVVDTENGAHFVGRDGVLQFKARSDRYNKITPVYVFGENTGSGEIPYEGFATDYDSTRLANTAQITQANTNQLFTAQDATSNNEYFPRVLTRTVNTTSIQECQDAANYLVSRYRQPAERVSALTLHPAANPSLLWPVCLNLELGTRVRVNRRPPAPAATVTVDCFVEQINWRWDNTGDVYVDLQCSPVDLTPYGVFASFHSTLNTSIIPGVNTFVLNSGQDNTNIAAAQIGVGQQLVLGQGTANAETVTVQAVGSSAPGWSTVTITLTANTVNHHTAGDIVCEPLPAGVTDPTTWDNVAKFDGIAFSY